MMPTREEIEAMAETILRETDYTATGQEAYDMLRTIAEHLSEREPVAWLYTMHMERNQKQMRMSAIDQSNPFGQRGVDYSSEYEITKQPLYATPTADVEDAKRYRYWRNGDGIAVQDAPIMYLNDADLDLYTDKAIAEQQRGS